METSSQPQEQTDSTLPSTKQPASRLTRRQLLGAGAGITGALLASGVLPALAQQAPSNVYLPLVQATTSDTNTATVEDASKKYNWKKVEEAFGNTKGMLESDGVFKIDLPRTDIQATINGIAVKPEFALTGEVTFQHKSSRDAMKFELALLDPEVNPFLDGLFSQDLRPEREIFTALHNHYLGDQPAIRFVHGFATGDAVELASALYKALKNNSATPFGHGEEPEGDPGFDAKKVEDIIGGEGELMNGVLSVSVERKEEFEERDVELEPAMELEHMFNFQAIENGQVATIDEFVLLKDEVDPVARELRKQGFLVTALHNHELDIKPELYYIHSWATGDPLTLAKSIHKVLTLTNSKFK